MVIELDTKEKIEKLKDVTLSFKEGCTHVSEVTFVVNEVPIIDLQMGHYVKFMGMTVDKREQPIGTYIEKGKYTKEFGEEIIPKGFMYRGTFEAIVRFFDQKGTIYLEYVYKNRITKNWD